MDQFEGWYNEVEGDTKLVESTTACGSRGITEDNVNQIYQLIIGIDEPSSC